MDKLNIKFNNPIMDQENIEKIAGKVNDIIDRVDGDMSTVDLKVKTIEQSEYNWESSNVEVANSWKNGLTVTESFVKLCVINKVLYIVTSLLVKNETESAISTANSSALISAITVPEDIAKKIYRKDGTSCDKAYVDNDAIIGVTYRLSEDSGANKLLLEGNVYSSNPNKIGIWANSSVTIPAGKTYIMDFRTFIVL